MKNIITILFSTLISTMILSQMGEDPIIMKIGGDEIKKSEFLQVYLKNNDNPEYDKKSLDEYMEMYKKLRLKVQEAKSQGYDTLPHLVKELQGYREQLSTPYMIDTIKSEELINEAYNRMKEEVRASHILIRSRENDLPKDTLNAYNKIMDIRKRILKGEDFGQLALKYSEDPSVKKNKGDLGYFSAFTMVYPFESASYKTNTGGVSMPVRSKFGYHLIKVNDKRKSRGKILTAHIMIVNKDRQNEQFASNKRNIKPSVAENKINEIYEKLENGEKFEDLALKYSQDPSSKQNGGVLPYFGTGTKVRMVPEFEEKAFEIKNDGEYSKPFKTDYGWHIVKRIHIQPIGSFEDLKREIKNRVNRDSRALKTQKSFIEKRKKTYNFKSLKEEKWNLVVENIDTSFFGPNFKPKENINEILFSFADKKYTVSDFLNYLAKTKTIILKRDLLFYINKKYNEFETKMIKDYEDSLLEYKYPQFKALMKEFRDGVLFYEIMNDNVWKKSNTDTLGLQKFYEVNKNKFMWGERVDVDILECDNKNIAKQARKMLKKKMPLDTIRKILNAKSKLNLNAYSKKLEKNKNKILQQIKLKKGINKPFEFEKKFVVIKVKDFLASQPKKLKEVKGKMSIEFQKYLEKTWLDKLKQKFPIEVNKDVLYSIGK